MTSLILQTSSRLIEPLLVMFSVFLLLRGHDAPGGGFVGGLMAASAFALHMIAFDVVSARRTLRVGPRSLIAGGLSLALAGGLIGPLAGRPFLTSLWFDVSLPGLGVLHLGTPLVFDLGVYFVVLGVALLIVFSLAEA